MSADGSKKWYLDKLCMAKNIVDSIVAKEAPGACDDDVEETYLEYLQWHLDEAEYEVGVYERAIKKPNISEHDLRRVQVRYEKARKIRDDIKKRYDAELGKQDKA